MIGITADLTRFSEAEEKFNRRVPMTRADADALRRNAADQAFWISNVAEARVVQDVRDSLSRALRDGTPLEEWKKGIKEQLEEHWLSDHPTRLDTIFRNAAQTSYNRGRYLQMTHKAVLKTRPYWMLDTILDERTSSICRHLSSPKPVILPADHVASQRYHLSFNFTAFHAWFGGLSAVNITFGVRPKPLTILHSISANSAISRMR